MKRRREFLFLLPARLAVPGLLFAVSPKLFRVRIITAGVPLTLDSRDRQLQQAAAFLNVAWTEFQARGSLGACRRPYV